MHAHMLSPVNFANDISSNPRYSSLAGKLNMPLLILQDKMQFELGRPGVMSGGDSRAWYAKFHKAPGFSPYDIIQVLHRDNPNEFPPFMYPLAQYNPRRFKFPSPPPFSFDLVAAVKRQMGFAQKITAMYPYDPVPDDMLRDSQQRYAKWMNLIRLNAVPNPVPALDIDLFWHTHQLEPTNYLPWCTYHVGRSINHDDTINETSLSSGLEETIAAWESAYQEDYINPGPGSGPTFQTAAPPCGPTLSFPNTNLDTNSNNSLNPTSPPNPSPPSHESTTADRIPPPGLTPAQLRLWNYDVEHQNLHEKMDYDLRQARSNVTSLNQQVNALSQPPTLSSVAGGGASSSGGGRTSGFMRRLVKAAITEISDSGPRNKLSVDLNSSKARVTSTIQFHDEMRQAWGRNRWPLLCAARGFGDATVTEGKFRRPPQGTATLDFPVYAATWYDNKQLGYYDYVTGGRRRDGKIDGGGIRMGAAMCGGRFDGGNCVARIIRPNNNPGCSGGGG
jgi:Glycine-rich domain-containing protein-like